MSPRPQRRDDNEDVGTDKRLLYSLPTMPRPYKDLGRTPWTDSGQWVPNGQSIYAKRKTGMPFDRKTRDASQPYTKPEFNRPFEQSSVKGPKASHASSG